MELNVIKWYENEFWLMRIADIFRLLRFQLYTLITNSQHYPTMSEKESSKAKIPTIPELLAPAGNYEKLVTAVHYGADAVYLGGKQFSLRAKAGNFSMESLEKGVRYAHKHRVKVYVTVNILAHNCDLIELDHYLKRLEEIGVDGLIISDPGILLVAKEVVPALSIHLSTQANVTNHASARYWFDQGVSRLNLARELSLAEIREIRSRSEGELEVFVHGALCISYSGRCMLSNYMTDRDANQGNCSHPCRYSYALTEEKRPGQYFPVEEDERGTYIFNSKDLCLLRHLPQLVAGGVDSLKIEGRMKSIFYVGGVVRIYRAALEYLRKLPQSAWERPEEIEIPKILLEEIENTGTRGLTKNFFDQPPTSDDMLYTTSRAEQIVEPVAVVRETGDSLVVEVRNTLETGEAIEYMGKEVDVQPVTVKKMMNEKGEPVVKAHPGNRILLELNTSSDSMEVNGIFRRRLK